MYVITFEPIDVYMYCKQSNALYVLNYRADKVCSEQIDSQIWGKLRLVEGVLIPSDVLHWMLPVPVRGIELISTPPITMRMNGISRRIAYLSVLMQYSIQCFSRTLLDVRAGTYLDFARKHFSPTLYVTSGHL